MSVGWALLESGERPPQGLFNLLARPNRPEGLQHSGSVSSMTSKHTSQTVHLRGSELRFTKHLLSDGPCSAVSGDIHRTLTGCPSQGIQEVLEDKVTHWYFQMPGKVIRFAFSPECFCSLAKKVKTAKGVCRLHRQVAGSFSPASSLCCFFFLTPTESLYVPFFFPFLELALPVSLWGSSLQSSRRRPRPTVLLGTERSGRASGRLQPSWKPRRFSPAPLACIFETLTTRHIPLSKVSVALFM